MILEMPNQEVENLDIDKKNFLSRPVLASTVLGGKSSEVFTTPDITRVREISRETCSKYQQSFQKLNICESNQTDQTYLKENIAETRNQHVCYSGKLMTPEFVVEVL